MNQTREIKNFIYSQYFSEGLRISFGVLLPSLLFAQVGLLKVGITLSLGAFAVSLADNTGPVIHKRNGMLLALVLMFFTALVTGFINQSPFLLMPGLLFFCFFYSMLTVYGDRASNVGTASLLIMILSLDQEVNWRENLVYALSLGMGGAWYFLLSMSLVQIRPFRLAQQELGECIRRVADYLRFKADFYDTEKDYEDTYRKLVNEQIAVHKEQDTVREILFKTREIVKESTKTGRQLLLIFSDIVDLFEQSMATHYDYLKIREQFGHTGVLKNFNAVIQKVAEELENLSYYITSNETPKPLHSFQAELEQLKAAIDRVEQEYQLHNLVLKKILINIRNIIQRIQKIYNYFHQKQLLNERRPTDTDRFVSHQDYDLKVFRENLTLDSAIFRHSLRVAIVSLIGYLVSIALPFGHHSYWILLTILVILKPGFSLTKKRNYQRLIGTLIGGIVGGLIVLFVQDETPRFILMLLFMIMAYSFLRHNYIISVLFMTPYILIMLSFIGMGGLSVARERIFDTIVGCVIAFTASYYIFPSWEYRQIKEYMRKVLVANYKYLAQAATKLSGKEILVLDYKLARKEVYVRSANLASAFQRMLSEPKSKQQHVKEIHKFVVMNHILSSYIATLLASIQQNENQLANPNHIKKIKRALYQLSEAVEKLNSGAETGLKEADLNLAESPLHVIEENPDSRLIEEELDFVLKVCGDINKLCQRFQEVVQSA